MKLVSSKRRMAVIGLTVGLIAGVSRTCGRLLHIQWYG